MAKSTSPARDKLEAYGIDAICEDIARGKKLGQISKELGVAIGSLSMWLERPENIDRYKAVQESMSPARDRLDEYGLDAVCEDIANGKTLTWISEKVGVSIGSVAAWIERPENSARVKYTRMQMAKVWDEMALDQIQAATDPFELNKAREAAHHYRWRASKIAPREYGDKLDITSDNEKISPFTALLTQLKAPKQTNDEGQD